MKKQNLQNLQRISKLLRYYILMSTTNAGSGHPSSCLSAVELMTALMFGGYFRFDVKNPANPHNDRLIFSKGHAAPLLYALWVAAGAVSEKELMSLRKFGSRLEGHPTPEFPYTELATGSLGQGLSAGLGIALAAKLDNLPYRTFVLLGDSEMAEGSNWEAMQLAVHYKLDNLIGIIDVNRLGQRGETMYGHNLKAYQKRIEAFGWKTILVEDGHDLDEAMSAFAKATADKTGKPVLIIAKTVKGKGVSFLEDKEGWHGRALSAEELTKALQEIGKVDLTLRGVIAEPQKVQNQKSKIKNQNDNAKFKIEYSKDKLVATRKAYGNALARIGQDPRIVVLDGEVSNSTYAEVFKACYPERFFEMFIAEQNMVGAALGLSRRGKIPFVSSFAAFLTRAFDQIRMSQYSNANIKFCGSHSGVSIGEDGPSQMGLEDIAMFRTLLNSVVLYPSDAIATEKLVEEAAKHNGIVYLRTTRKDTPIIYKPTEKFPIGGSKVLRQSRKDTATVIAAGIILHEALAAYEELQKEKINIRVIDLYSIKPLDVKTLQKAAKETKAIITVEDHFAEGGIGEAVASALACYLTPTLSDIGEGERVRLRAPIHSLAVRKTPRSGKPEELLAYEGINRIAIIKKIKELSS